MKILKHGFVVLALMAVVGCRDQVTELPAAATGTSKYGELYTPEAEAGVDLAAETVSAGLETVQEIAARKVWPNRNDPFSLLPSERTFEEQQALERILSEGGGFSVEFEVPEPNYEEEKPTIQPQPLWRLAGIAVAEGSVLALLDTGQSVDIIRPGSSIEGTEWTCVSIDLQRAIFRRSGNNLPREIIVQLGAPLNGGGGVGGATGGSPPSGIGGPPSGGRPGGPPGGDFGGREDR